MPTLEHMVQNGFAEKRIDTIEVRANASLTTAGLEKKYLVDAINYVVAIDNRLPTFADRCPYDIFFQPTLQKAHRLKLAPFGCRTLALRPVHLRRKKEGIRRDECVLLGLADGSKRGYKLLRMETQKTIIRGDVKFYPSTFPFRDEMSDHEVCSEEELDDPYEFDETKEIGYDDEWSEVEELDDDNVVNDNIEHEDDNMEAEDDNMEQEDDQRPRPSKC